MWTMDGFVAQSCIDHGCFCVNNVDHRCLLCGSWMFLHRCVLWFTDYPHPPNTHTHNPAHMFRFTDYPLHAPTHLPLLTFCLTLFTCSGSLTTLPTHLPPAHFFSHPAHMFRFTDYPPHSLPPCSHVLVH